jgi:hypothetical protein
LRRLRAALNGPSYGRGLWEVEGEVGGGGEVGDTVAVVEVILRSEIFLRRSNPEKPVNENLAQRDGNLVGIDVPPP